MKVLVCGGRDFNDRNLIYRYLYEICDKNGLWHEPDEYGNTMPNGITVISGEAKGADQIATDWAVVNWTGYEGYPADWDKYGKAAGPIRNQQMLDEGKPDLVLAFPGGRGTAHMVGIAKKAGVRVIEVS